jgi:hypothetical protein
VTKGLEGHLETAMKQVAPRISGETTMWKAWVGLQLWEREIR